MSQAEREEDLRERQEFRASNLFQTMDGETLLSQPLGAQPFLVSQLIPQGLHILGGAPKIGKSWLVLWMCLKIAMGEPIWNYETRQGTVLYLALEDSFERLQSRLLEISDEAPSCLHFAVMAKNISDGLDKQIESFIEEHPDTSFIAIDTLQNIRGEDNSANPYANDYKDLSVLKEIAYKHHIAIFLVHHLRKQKDIDPLNMLSGTTGLSGAVDTAFILDRAKRTETIATLFCSGRDIETVEIPIEFCEKEFTWKMREDDKTPIKMLDEVVSAVDNYFSTVVNKSFSGTATELAEMIKVSGGLEITPAILSKRLLCYHSQFCNLGYTCEFGRTNQGRFIKIEMICDRQLTTAASDGSDGKNDMELGVNSSVTPSPKV